ncbi:MAG: urate hydroxylase PuuD [Hyphomicrobiales bacterium]|nr:urate hydroxylase PuuD [Hyphomicrobiales bacterium]
MVTVYYEWASLLLRWTHIISGIAWIGSSFYFMHLDAAIKGVPEIPAGKGGEAWEVHGGGFYQVRKYLVAPERLPKELIWHKWQAYSTWLSGFALLVWIYYIGADLFLVDPGVRALAPWQAAAIGIVSLVVGWEVYDRLVKSPLAKNEVALAAVGFAYVTAMAWFYQQVFSGRGALIHSGALMGTMMVGNVAMNIMPNQRKVIADLVAGREPNPEYGKQAKTRSRHNNYLTLPVLFLMLSSHFPLTYQTRFAWAIVALVLVAGALIRHFYNERHAGRGDPWWTWAVAALCMWLAIWISASSAPGGREALGLSPLSRTDLPASAPKAPVQVASIVMGRCGMCHARTPSFPGIGEAPKGIRLDTPRFVERNRYEIGLWAVATRAMPPANVSGVTDDERATLARWVAKR